jgi:hypothetical protein
MNKIHMAMKLQITADIRARLALPKLAHFVRQLHMSARR